MTEESSPWVRGWMAPVAGEITSREMTVRGEIPRELNGQLVRIGPNPVAEPGPEYHWFGGDGMVHSIRLEDGEAVEYRNRWVRTPHACEALDEPCQVDELEFFDVANTNAVGYGDAIYAITESCTPYRLDADLSTVGHEFFGLDKAPHFTAHPHVDPVSGEWHAVGYGLDDQAKALYYRIGRDRRAKAVETIDLGGPTSVHDFGMTESHILFFDLPLVFNRELSDSGSPVPYRWSPAHQPRVGVMPRNGRNADVRWFEVPSGWVFHTVNAFDVVDDNGDVAKIVWDVVRFEKIFDDVVTGPGDPYPPQLYRWEIDLRSGTVTQTEVDGRVQEFPRIDERLWGHPYRYAYTTELLNAAGGSSLLSFDLQGGSAAFELPAGHHLSEAVFVPRSDSSAENDGWLLAVDHDDATMSSELLILEAANVADGPIARVGLPQRIPAGFHGNWVGG